MGLLVRQPVLRLFAREVFGAKPVSLIAHQEGEHA